MKNCRRFLIATCLASISISSTAQTVGSPPGPVQRAHPLERPAPVRREPLVRPRGSKEVAKNGKVAAAIEEAMREDVANAKSRKAGEVDYIRDPCLLNPALPQCKKPDPRSP